MPQLVRVQGNLALDGELFLFTNVRGTQALPAGNAELLAEKEGVLLPDDFSHEQYLVITDGKRKLLVSGCAHNGILNILEEYEKVVGGEPDAVISGFHMKKKQGYEAADIAVIEETARRLSRMHTKFFTGHCTGEEPFARMCAIMGSQLQYVRSGEEVFFK